MKTHSTVGPSAAKRWLACPGSVVLIERLGLRSPPTAASVYGDAVHQVLEEVILSGADPLDLLGQVRTLSKTYHEEPENAEFVFTDGSGNRSFRIDHEMLEHVNGVLDLVSGIEREHGRPVGGWDVEQRVTLEPLGAPIEGTVDLLGIWPGEKPRIAIIDLKTGRVDVEAESPQVRLYALGAMVLAVHRGMVSPDDPNLTVETFIVQAKSREATKRATYRGLDLLDWCRNDVAAALAEVEQARSSSSIVKYLVTGDHCRFCPVKSRCPMVFFEAMDWTEVSEQQLPELTNAQLADLLDRTKKARDLHDRLKDEALRRLEAGQEIPGWHVTLGRGSRSWRPGAEDVLVERYGAEAYRRELLSPAQIEARFADGKNVTAEWAVTTPGRLTVAQICENGPVAQTTRADAVARLISSVKRRMS